MRFISPLVIALAVLVVGIGPSPAQKKDEPQEIKGELIGLGAGDETSKGFTVNPYQFYPGPGPASVIYVYLRKDTQIMFSDKQKAQPSDLKLGQLVSVRTKKIEPIQLGPRAGADVVVIEKSARTIYHKFNNVKDADEIAKQVDFATECLVVFRWIGYGMDRVSLFSVKEDKDGPVVVFNYTEDYRKYPHNGRQLLVALCPTERTSIFAIAKNARFSGGPCPGTKITNSEELAKALKMLPAVIQKKLLSPKEIQEDMMVKMIEKKKIEKLNAIARPIVARKDADDIAKQVDFAKEYLVLFRWRGFGQDGVSFTVKEEKDGPVVVFIHIEDPRLDSGAEIKLTLGPRSSIFAIAKNARFTGGPSEGTKITSAAELAKALTGQKNDDADKAKRRAEIQKEIGELQEKIAKRNAEVQKEIKELQEKIGKLTADFAGLQPVANEKSARAIYGVRGIYGANYPNYLDVKDADKIAKQVDFATECLVLFRWRGYQLDHISLSTVKEDKDGPVVFFSFTEDWRISGLNGAQPMILLLPQPRSCLFAIPKNARFSVSGGLVGGTKISTAEELTKALTKAP